MLGRRTSDNHRALRRQAAEQAVRGLSWHYLLATCDSRRTSVLLGRSRARQRCVEPALYIIGCVDIIIEGDW